MCLSIRQPPLSCDPAISQQSSGKGPAGVKRAYVTHTSKSLKMRVGMDIPNFIQTGSSRTPFLPGPRTAVRTAILILLPSQHLARTHLTKDRRDRSTSKIKTACTPITHQVHCPCPRSPLEDGGGWRRPPKYATYGVSEATKLPLRFCAIFRVSMGDGQNQIMLSRADNRPRFGGR